MRKTYSLLILILVLAAAAPSNAQVPVSDLKGAKEPAFLKRYEGSVIVRYRQKAFDAYLLPLGHLTYPRDYANSQNLEGRVTRISYVGPDGRSSLEVFANYRDELKNKGFEVLFEGDKDAIGESFPQTYDVDYLGQIFEYSPAAEHYIAARLPANEGDTYVALFVTEFQDGYVGDMTIPKGRVVVQLDVVETKPMEKKMVAVNSGEMAKSIGSSGKIALYGIYFDTNKADVKSESEPTLIQIAKLLTENESLKLLVVGHTDNEGGLDSNLDLSRRRAASVVNALVTKYHVSASRLSSNGVGYLSPVANNKTEDGRAKNRRVELVEQ
jgi:outer membrane protein OmpA-like peptidoglycan-associated protein